MLARVIQSTHNKFSGIEFEISQEEYLKEKLENIVGRAIEESKLKIVDEDCIYNNEHFTIIIKIKKEI